MNNTKGEKMDGIESGKENVQNQEKEKEEEVDVRKVCVKRTGEIVPFDETKIESAVRKAILVCLFFVCVFLSSLSFPFCICGYVCILYFIFFAFHCIFCIFLHFFAFFLHFFSFLFKNSICTLLPNRRCSEKEPQAL